VSCGQTAGEAGDFVAVADDEVFHDEGIGQASAVESAIDFYGEDGLAVTVGSGEEFEGDVDGEDFFFRPGHDGGVAANLAADVVNDGVRSKGGLEGVGVMGVSGVEVKGDGGGQGEF